MNVPYIIINGIEVETAHIMLDLNGCLEKLRRAQEHLAVFEDELWSFLDSDPYGALGEIEGEHGWYVFRVEVRRQPPIRIGVIFGEYINQLRSTLDHLMWQLATWHMGRRPPESTVFPLQDTQKGADRLMDRLETRIPADWHAAIKALQPVGRDSHALGLLERLWNRDKHQTVIPVPITEPLLLSQTQFVANEDAGPILESRPRTGVRLEDGAELARVKIKSTGPNPRVDMYVLTSLKIESLGIVPRAGDLSFAEFMVRGMVSCFPGGEGALLVWDQPRDSYSTAITTLSNEGAAQSMGFHIPESKGRPRPS